MHACMHEDPLPEGLTTFTTVKIGVLLPHEVFSSLYNYGKGELFYKLLCGTPDAPNRQSRTLLICVYITKIT